MILAQQEAFQNEVVNIRAHETTIAVGWSANDRLASHVEARIHDDWATRSPPKSLDDLPVQRIAFASHRLNSRRTVDVCDSRNLFLGRHVGNQQHVRTVAV